MSDAPHDPSIHPEPSPRQRYEAALALLKPRPRRFVVEYLACLNGAEAARRAGYSEATARSIGSENLTKPDIAAAVAAGLELQTMPAAEVIARMTQHARGSLESFLDIDDRGHLQGFVFKESAPLHLLKRASIVERTIKEVTERTFTIELHDPQASLRDLAKIHGLFVDRKEITGKDGGAIAVEQFSQALNTAYADDPDSPAE